MELTKEQKQGLDMLSRLLNKKYPFIVGVAPIMKDFEDYASLICIEVIVKRKLAENYFNQKIDNKWDTFWKFSNIFYPNPDETHAITQEIKEIGNGFYRSLTDEYQFEASSIITDRYRRVKINQFKLDDTD